MHVHDSDAFCGPAADFDPLPVVIDVSGLGTSGFRAADLLREHHSVTHAGDRETTEELLATLRDLAQAAPGPLRGHR